MGYIGNAPVVGVVSGDNIVDGSVDTADIKNSAVTAAKLASGAAVSNIGYTPVNKEGDTITGNLGIGVTPSAWSTGKAIQLNNVQASIWGAGDQINVISNAYFDGAYKYAASKAASMYEQALGVHTWSTAASGTAGSTISFTEIMTASGGGFSFKNGTGSHGAFDVDLSVGAASWNYGFIRLGQNNLYCLTWGGGASGYGDTVTIQNPTNYPLVFGTNNTERARITSGGDFCVGITGASGKLHVNGTTDGSQVKISGANQQGLEFRSSTNTAGYLIGRAYGSNNANDFFIYDTANSALRVFINTGGEVCIASNADQGAYNLQCNGTGVWGAGAYVNGSDARLKDNIQSIDSCLDVVNALRPVTFQYKPEHSKDQSVQTGFIAQELQQALAGKPYLDGLVQKGPEYLNVAYQNIIPLLTKAIQEQQAMIEDLKAKVAALEAN